MKSASIQEVIIRLLARRVHTAAELRAKLGRRGFEDSEIERVLLLAEQKGWVDDSVAAEIYVGELIRRGGHGRRWAAGKLAQRGLDRELSSETLSRLWNDSIELTLAGNALDRWLKSSAAMKKTGGDLLAAARSALRNRGFEPEIISKVCAGGFENRITGAGEYGGESHETLDTDPDS